MLLLKGGSLNCVITKAANWSPSPPPVDNLFAHKIYIYIFKNFLLHFSLHTHQRTGFDVSIERPFRATRPFLAPKTKQKISAIYKIKPS